MFIQQIKPKIYTFLNLKPGEGCLLLFASLYFYLLLCAYYIIRPIRNEMVIQNGIDNIQWLLLGAALVMLVITPIFGWLTNRFKTQQFLTICTLFFVVNLIVFALLFKQFSTLQHSPWVSRSFYIWVNVFNMFIISLFWSYMNDSFSQAQAKRLFAAVAAGGTAGALTGPLIAVSLVETVGQGNLLLIAAGILTLTIVCILMIRKYTLASHQEQIPSAADNNTEQEQRFSGSVLDGIKMTISQPYLRMIALFVIIFAVISTFLAIELAAAIEQLYQNPEERTKLFSLADLAANSLTLFLQVFLTSRIIRWIGYQYTLLILPILFLLGFILIGFFPGFVSLVILSVCSRAGKYAILNPTSEMLFSIVSREQKYKAKNFIDTAIVRSSNVLSSWLIVAIKATGAGGMGVILLGTILSALWCRTAYWLGEQYQISTNSLKKTTEKFAKKAVEKND